MKYLRTIIWISISVYFELYDTSFERACCIELNDFENKIVYNIYIQYIANTAIGSFHWNKYRWFIESHCLRVYRILFKHKFNRQTEERKKNKCVFYVYSMDDTQKGHHLDHISSYRVAFSWIGFDTIKYTQCQITYIYIYMVCMAYTTIFVTNNVLYSAFWYILLRLPYLSHWNAQCFLLEHIYIFHNIYISYGQILSVHRDFMSSARCTNSSSYKYARAKLSE